MTRRAGFLAVTALVAALAGGLGGCASGEPLDMSLAASTSQIEVVALGDGFVRTGTRRLPREAFVLELRQTTRRMKPAERAGLRVVIGVEAEEHSDAEGRTSASADVAWLIDQLGIMAVQQVQYLPGPR